MKGTKMSNEHIRSSIEDLVGFLTENPEEGRHTNAAATAKLESGLRFRLEGPKDEVVICDMPPKAGGGGSAPSPGWFMQAALAGCDATMIAMKAAMENIKLSTLEVTVDSESDTCGLLGVNDSIKAGPFHVRTRIRIGAIGVEEEKLRDIVRWAEDHSWVRDAICRAIPSKSDVEVV
jgi:uncharacterized OsmC-like protein